ncbi:hypothetical protein EGW08_021228, partial [Elysia chlorotica]
SHGFVTGKICCLTLFFILLIGGGQKRLDAKFRKRLKRRLHYGDMADLDVPSLPLTEFSVDYFHDSAPEKLGHVDMEMASNIVKQNKVTPCSMVVSVLYARRLRQRNRQYLDSISSSDVFFISMMMASKYMYDEGTDDEVYNDEWAASVDQEVCDVNKMEMDFLQAMDWGLFVRPEEFEETLDAIEKRLALKEGLKRGWFTYAELDVLMGPDLISSICCGLASDVSKFLATLSAAYVTGLLSMLGSVALATQVSGPLSSAAVALMALHSFPSTLSPLGNNLDLLPISRHDAGLCGERCPGLAKIVDGDLLVELNGQEINGTGVMDGWPLDKQDNMNKSLLHGSGQNFGNNPSSGDRNAQAGRKLGSDLNNVAWIKEENDGFNSGVGIYDGETKGSETLLAPPSPHVTSSLWSLWFLDSLLSQIWSLTSGLKYQNFRKRSRAGLNGCRFRKLHQDGVLNGRDAKCLNVGGSSGDMSPSRCSKSPLFRRRKLCHGKALSGKICLARCDSTPAARIEQRAEDQYYPDDPATSTEESSQNVGEPCGLCTCNACSSRGILLSGYDDDQSDPHRTACRGFHFRKTSDPHSSSCADALGPRTESDRCPHGHGFRDVAFPGRAVFPGQHQTIAGAPRTPEPGGRIHAHHQDDPALTQAYLLNLPTSLFSGVYRMLQVA